jgi:hypothetical protein
MKICLEEVFDLAAKTAENRHEQKAGYRSCLQLSPNYELVGILGEMVFSLIIGSKMDLELRAEGDDGYDFDKINIKSSEEHKAKHLIEFTDKIFKGFYVFVIINLKHRYGYVKGFIHSQDFIKKGEIIDFGYGERLAMNIDLLKPWEPKRPIKLKNIYEPTTTGN